MPRPSPDRVSQLPALNAGTILSCPQCGMGLYMLTKKVTRDGTFEGSVKPLVGVPEYARGSLPKKCPFCQTGEWWYPPGTVYTLQHGWVS
jgi:uncharacterized protein (DUF983 family)